MQDSKQLIFLILHKFKYWFLLMGILLFLSEAALIALPYITKILVDFMISIQGLSHDNLQKILIFGSLIVCGGFVASIFSRLASYTFNIPLIHRVRFFMDMYVFDYVSQHSSTYFSNQLAGVITKKIRSITSELATFLTLMYWELFTLFLQSFLSISLLFYSNIILGFITLIWLIITLYIMLKLAPIKTKLNYKRAAASSQTLGKIVDVITNISIIHFFSSQSYERKKIKQQLLQEKKAWEKSLIFTEKILIIGQFLVFIFRITLLLSAIFLLKKGLISLGDIIFIFQISGMLAEKVTFVGLQINNIFGSYGGIQEGVKTIFVNHDIINTNTAKKLIVKTGSIHFKNVSFQYSDRRPIIKNLNLTIQAQEKVGIVGLSGSGKTTLLHLLLRLHNINKGSITIDNQDISKVTVESVRQSIAIVPQEPVLFHRSIKDNICYMKPHVTQNELKVVAQKAQVFDFAKKLEQGFDTLVGDRGAKLSGGQKQRVAIARAIMKDSNIILLDEATSSLDSISEQNIHKAFIELIKEKTVLVVAHRLSTLQTMDRIIVMDKGHIAEEGNHKALLKKQGLYYDFWKQQMFQEE